LVIHGLNGLHLENAFCMGLSHADIVFW